MERRKSGLPIFDLTAANPTQCGFQYPADLLLALQHPEALRYDPDPRGLPAAREAVCKYYHDHLHQLSADRKQYLSAEQVLLTSSTSEAYSFLFRLLCDPDDEILIARPSYPLFDFLAVLDDVKLVPYQLFYDHGWHIDVHGLRALITPRTRAIVVVHPNNPTGHFTSGPERTAIETICEEFDLALIVDEVFLDYGFSEIAPSFIQPPHPVLTFVLSGLSKVAGMPQMKLSWVTASGPQLQVESALSRLEIIADTFLSVSPPLQLALPTWLSGRKAIQQQIRTRISQNLETLDGLLSNASLVDRLFIQGGWYAIVRAPAIQDGEGLALRLMQDEGVSVHPGSFFGMGRSGYFVVSLLPTREQFTEGADRLIRILNRDPS